MNKYIIMMLALTIPAIINAQMMERKGGRRAAYKVEESAQVNISNKYGNIVLIPWEKDSVVFEVDYIVKSSKPQTVDALFQMIDFSFFGSPYHVSASTKLQMEYSSVSNILRTITAGSNTLSINYTVHYPSSAQLKLENRFGNIHMNNTKAPVNIILENGDLSAGAISGSLKLEIMYGNANIASMKDGNITVTSGDIDVKTATVVQVQSKLSRINFETVDKLTISSFRDKYYVGSVESLTGKTNFTHLNLYNLETAIQLDSKYGGVYVSKSSKTLKNININGDYSSISIYLNNQVAANFELIYTSGTNLVLTADATVKSKVLVPESKNTYKSVGQIAGTSGNTQIFIKNREGQISIINN